MRRALLLMILINSITFVTNNLAMEEEKIGIGDIEMQAVGLAAGYDSEKAPLLEDENIIHPDLSNSEEQPSELKKSCGRLLKKGCRYFCRTGTVVAIIATVAAPPTLSITLGAESRDGINGMVESASPITAYPTNVTHKPDCTYEQYEDFDYPPGMACMQGSCNVTYAYPPGCAPSEQNQGGTGYIPYVGGDEKRSREYVRSSRGGRGGYGRGNGRSCGRGGKMRRVTCSIERCNGAEKFEKECKKARDCGCAQMVTVPIAWLASSIACCCLGRKSKSKDE